MRRLPRAGIAAVLLLASAAAADTPTPTFPPNHHACPDVVGGDDRCIIALAGSERFKAAVWPGLTWLLVDADICDLTATGQTSPELAFQQVALAFPGPTQGVCSSVSGTMLRGADGPVDGVVASASAYYDFDKTRMAPAQGIAHGPDTPCRVDKAGGFVGTWATDTHAKCKAGSSWKTPCIPGGTACPEDPGDGSFCAEWSFLNGEAGVTVSGDEPCQQATNIQTVYDNLTAVVEANRFRGAFTVLVSERLPATSDPNYSNLAAMRSWLHAFVRSRQATQPLGLVDLESWGDVDPSTAVDACIENLSVFLDPTLEAGEFPRMRCSAPNVPRNEHFTPWIPTETATATRTATAIDTPTRTATETSIPATPTRTPTAAATPTSTNTGTQTPTGGMTAGPTAAPSVPLTTTCSDITKALLHVHNTCIDEAGTSVLRALRDKAKRIYKGGAGLGYVPGDCTMGGLDPSKCEIRFEWGASAYNNQLTPPTLDNEKLCNRANPVAGSDCSSDMATNTNHDAGTGKLGSGSCFEADWATFALWAGRNDPLCGRCSGDGSISCSVTTDSCACRGLSGGVSGQPNCKPTNAKLNTTCPANKGVCEAIVDTYRFGDDPNDSSNASAPPPLPKRQKPKAREIYFWETVNFLDRKFTKPIDDYGLDALLALPTPPTRQCAEAILNQGYEQLSQNMPSACVGTCTLPGNNGNVRYCTWQSDCPDTSGDNNACNIASGCRGELGACLDVYDTAATKGACGTVNLLAADGSSEEQKRCPTDGSDAGAQIPCATWSTICRGIIQRLDMLRYACLQRPAPGLE